MNTEISRYLVDANGNSFSSDTDLQSLSNNSKVKNTNSGVSYKKVPGTTSGVPVFDKVPFQEGQPDAVLYSQQSLTSAQKQQARTNIGASSDDAVLYSQQTLTSSQKEQARANIGVDKAVLYSQQELTSDEISTVMSNLGIDKVGGIFNDTWHNFYLRFGNTQVCFGSSTKVDNSNAPQAVACFKFPFVDRPWVSVSPLISKPGLTDATAGLIAGSVGPRTALLGFGRSTQLSRGSFIAIGRRFNYDNLGFIELHGSSNKRIPIETSGTYNYLLSKSLIKVPDSSRVYFLVDMFLSRDASSSDYIELDGGSIQDVFGKYRVDTTVTDDSSSYVRGWDVDLGLNTAENDTIKFVGYSDHTNMMLFQDSEFNQYKMSSFVISFDKSDFFSGVSEHSFNFNCSLSGSSKGRIRIFYIAKD